MKINEAILIIDKKICKNIEYFHDEDRGFLSQNILSDLRDLVEHTSLKAFSRGTDIDITYDNLQKGNEYVRTVGQFQFLHKFHKFLQISASHYTLEEGHAERLMLKYYEYMIKIKELLKENYRLEILSNLDKFPLEVDTHLNVYYEKISEKIKKSSMEGYRSDYNDRYYIRKIKPFFIAEKVYYEVTFTTANDNASKFDRMIAFTNIDLVSNYAVKFWIRNDIIEVLGKKMPIKIIENYEISIRPCEFNNFARIFGLNYNITINLLEYRELMSFILQTGVTLNELVCMPGHYYEYVKKKINERSKQALIFELLDRCREIMLKNLPGENILKYLLYKMNNKIIKSQINNDTCHRLSDLHLEYGCIPFEQMPFNTSLINHNPRLIDLLLCLDIANREHELFARMIKNNTEIEGQLFTSKKDINGFEHIDSLINTYNDKLYYKHKQREIKEFKKQIYIKGYEENTVEIINSLHELTKEGVKGYRSSVDYWLASTSHIIDCEEKTEAVRNAFDKSSVSLIYGAAGTGKTTLINHLSNFFNDEKKIYLANTNPAVDNVKQKVYASNCSYYTVARFLTESHCDINCDVLFIDECSTVSNTHMHNILKKASFKLLVLVGDIFQIQSIRFGNWFEIVRSFIPRTSVFELKTPHRSKEQELLKVWQKVRVLDDDVLEHLTRNDYTSDLDETIFQCSTKDEIVLCLNYDGLYGINNINRLLQGNNPNPNVIWGVQTYKVGDPILFNESNRFYPLIYNNAKGKIMRIEVLESEIIFDILLDRPINAMQASGYDFELIDQDEEDNSFIRFSVNKFRSTDEDDDLSSDHIVPFQVAYAISIHKAQGLEYRSVKVVITDEVDEKITHNIFYTAITRARKKLRIYWTPETEKNILSSFKRRSSTKDISLISVKNEFNK